MLLALGPPFLYDPSLILQVLFTQQAAALEIILNIMFFGETC